MHLSTVSLHGKLPVLLAWALGVLAAGCTASVADGNTPSGRVASNQAGQLPQTTQLIVRFKPELTALRNANCSAAYLALAGAQKGYTTSVKNVLFSGAQVVALSLGPSAPPSNSSSTSLSSGAALAFVGYLGQQAAVDYAELDTKQQTMAGATSSPRPTADSSATSTSTARQSRSVTDAQIVFRDACGSGVAEPLPAR